MLKFTNAIEIEQAPEWADTVPGTWTARGVTTPDEKRAWYDERGLVELRSDDPAVELMEFYDAWIKCGNDPTKWNHLKAPAGWRDKYNPGW